MSSALGARQEVRYADDGEPILKRAMGIEPRSEAWKTGNKVEARMRPKPRLTLASFLVAALQRQLNQRDFGGGVW